MLILLPINNILSSASIYYKFDIANITIALYIILFIYGTITMFKTKIYKKDIIIILLLYVFYGINYIISSEEAKPSFYTVNMLIIYLYYIPLSIIFASHIKNWGLFFNNKKILITSDILIIVSFIAKIIFRDIDSYLVFSYDILPICGITAVSAIHYKNKKQILFLIISLIGLIIFGSRGVVLWLLICSTLIFITDLSNISNKKQLYKKISRLTIICIATASTIACIFPYLLNTSVSDSSYIVRRIEMGNITESDSRTKLYQIANKEIIQTGININGLYYDRLILPKNMYSHNFIIEILLSFGLIIGVIIIIALMCCIFKAYAKCPKEYKYIVIYFISVLFLRYLVSGSIFSEGKFILFVAILLSILRINNHEKIASKKDSQLL